MRRLAWYRPTRAERNRRVDKLCYGGKKGRAAKRWLNRYYPGWWEVMAS